MVDQSQTPYELESFTNVLHLYNPKLTGLTAAKNFAVQFVRTEIVLFLDDDIEVLNDCVAEIKHEFLTRPQAAAIGCLAQDTRSFRRRLYSLIFEHGFFNRTPINRAEGFELRHLSGGQSAIRTTILKREKFDESLSGVGVGEDFEFSKRAKRYGEFWLCRTAHVYHHGSLKNRMDRFSWESQDWHNTLCFYDKLQVGKDPWNRLWLVFWIVGVSVQWVLWGLGLPPIHQALRMLRLANPPKDRTAPVNDMIRW